MSTEFKAHLQCGSYSRRALCYLISNYSYCLAVSSRYISPPTRSMFAAVGVLVKPLILLCCNSAFLDEKFPFVHAFTCEPQYHVVNNFFGIISLSLWTALRWKLQIVWFLASCSRFAHVSSFDNIIDSFYLACLLINSYNFLSLVLLRRCRQFAFKFYS